MKICAIICEYNPFHNGHLYQLNEARKQSGADAVVCIMSGNFVQRGEAAVLDKHIRAGHAALAGVDAVIGLPTVFATSPAEIFAKGAIKLLSAIPGVKALSFGCECGAAEDFFHAARTLEAEPEAVTEQIKASMKNGASYASARAKAWETIGHIQKEFLASPNCILGIEYARALLHADSDVEIFPVKRRGSGYSETKLYGDYPSATALRAAIARNEAVSGIPDYVRETLPESSENCLEAIEKFALLERSAEEIKSVLDCREGLENALKKAAEKNTDDIATALTSKRYTTSRIRRILLHNLLNISETFIRECLSSPLYLELLAVKKEGKDVLSALGESTLPLLIRAGDSEKLTGTARECFQKEKFSDSVFRIVRGLAPRRNDLFV